MAAPIHLSRKKAAKNPSILRDALNDFLAFADISRLTPVQKVAYLAYDYSSTALLVGGHREYFLQSIRAPEGETIAALRTIGAGEQANILEAANKAVNAAMESAPQLYSNRRLAGIEFADLIEFDDALECCARSVPDALLDYLQKHEAEFITWKP